MQLLERPTGADRNARQRRVDEVHGQLGLGSEPLR
jgi:hypothetical protein